MSIANCTDFESIRMAIFAEADSLKELDLHDKQDIETAEDKIASMQLDLGALLQSVQSCERRAEI